MEIRDLIVTPFFILLAYAGAYFVRNYACNAWNYRYYFPALTLKIIGAISLGFIYQYYYDGGDTFNYHTSGSRVIWNLFLESPFDALQLILLPTTWYPENLQHFASTSIVFYSDPASYFVVRALALVDLFTFSTYSATAVVFAAFSFVGAWMMFVALTRAYPHLLNWLAIPMFFIPSVFFWGSGILKDTLVMAALGALVYFMQAVFILKRPTVLNVVGLLLCAAVIYMTKKYVLLCFLPAALLWIYLKQFLSIRSLVLRIMLFPLLLLILATSGYYAVRQVGSGDTKYSIDKLATTARITAYDIRYYTGKNAGSGYSLGELDGTFIGMLKLAPQSINVSLFRPYLWEVNNPLMLMAALESLIVLLMTVFIVLRNPLQVMQSFTDPYVIFSVVFSITFAFAVGVSTFNFGTLVRYKIPLLPFYVVALMLINNFVQNRRAANALALGSR